MHNELNESVFDAVLQKAFCDYDDELMNSYPDCETLSRMYLLPKKEKRFFDRMAKEKQYGKPIVSVYLTRAAVIFLCLVTLAVAAVMTNPTVRAAVKNVVVEWFDKYSLFTFVRTESADFERIDGVKIGYIPDGYALVNTDSSPGDITYVYYSAENDEDFLTVDVFENETSDLFLDGERSKYTETRINGREAWSIYDDANGGGSLILVGSKISVCISANLPESEIVKIAESVE